MSTTPLGDETTTDAITCATVITTGVETSEPIVAVRLLVPLLTAVTTPAALTVATPVLALVHVTVGELIGRPFEPITTTASVRVRPRAPNTMGAAGGVIVIDAGVMTGAVPVVVPSPPPHDDARSRASTCGLRRIAIGRRIMWVLGVGAVQGRGWLEGLPPNMALGSTSSPHRIIANGGTPWVHPAEAGPSPGPVHQAATCLRSASASRIASPILPVNSPAAHASSASKASPF